MKTITTRLEDRSYRIQIDAGLLDQVGFLTRAATDHKSRQAVIISNPKVASLYGQRVARALRQADFRAREFLIGDGERFKNFRVAQSIYSFLIERRIERSDIIVALGGGVVGDLAGFVAATYLRGVRVVQVPTTLIAQIDSSVGGKTAVNHAFGKNLIGAFHQPRLVVIDIETLKTLPPREMRSGLWEAVKYGVIRDRRLFYRIAREIEKLKQFDAAELSRLIARSCEIKAEIVARDEKECGLRRILNFGHTVGHALESVTRYRRFHHGEAVGYGMLAASRIAEMIEMLDSSERAAIDEAIRCVGSLPAARNLALRDIISAMQHDKKAEAGRLVFVLPVKIGRVVIRSDVPPRVVRLALKDTLL